MKFRHLFLATLLVLSACDILSTPEPTPTPTPGPYEEIDSICLVTDTGSINDNTFNQYAYEGMIELTESYRDLETNYFETHEGEDVEEQYTTNIQSCIDVLADIVVTVGFTITNATLEAARANPDVYFIGVDQDVEAIENAPDNYAGIQAAEHEAGFLVGVIAASVANEIGGDVIGGVYGLEVVPAVVRFRTGYEQGALYVNPDWEPGVNILGEYTDSFVDPDQGADIASNLIEQGAVVIFGAGGLTGSGAIAEAASQGIYVIGVDQDEYFTTFDGGQAENAEFIITSAVKRVDRGVRDVAALLLSGQESQFPGGSNYILNAISSGIGFAEFHDSDISPEIGEYAQEIYAMMLSGELSTGVDPVTGELLETVEATEESD